MVTQLMREAREGRAKAELRPSASSAKDKGQKNTRELPYGFALHGPRLGDDS